MSFLLLCGVIASWLYFLIVPPRSLFVIYPPCVCHWGYVAALQTRIEVILVCHVCFHFWQIRPRSQQVIRREWSNRLWNVIYIQREEKQTMTFTGKIKMKMKVSIAVGNSKHIPIPGKWLWKCLECLGFELFSQMWMTVQPRAQTVAEVLVPESQSEPVTRYKFEQLGF